MKRRSAVQVVLWSLAATAGQLGVGSPGLHGTTGAHLHVVAFSSHFRVAPPAGPADFPLPFPVIPTAGAASAVNLTGTLQAGSGTYHRALQAPSGPAFSLRFSRDGSTALPASIASRLSVIRLR